MSTSFVLSTRTFKQSRPSCSGSVQTVNSVSGSDWIYLECVSARLRVSLIPLTVRNCFPSTSIWRNLCFVGTFWYLKVKGIYSVDGLVIHRPPLASSLTLVTFLSSSWCQIVQFHKVRCLSLCVCACVWEAGMRPKSLWPPWIRYCWGSLSPSDSLQAGESRSVERRFLEWEQHLFSCVLRLAN